jgi:hypothetical protein
MLRRRGAVWRPSGRLAAGRRRRTDPTLEVHVETADSTYGSEKDGLVCGYLFVHGAPATPIDADAAAEWLAAAVRSPTDSFVWLNFSLANAASERWIRRHLSLPESFLECLHGDIASTRLEQDGDALVPVIHDVLFDFTFDPGSVSTVSLCVEPCFLISARLRPLRSVDRDRARPPDQSRRRPLRHERRRHSPRRAPARFPNGRATTPGAHGASRIPRALAASRVARLPTTPSSTDRRIR